jgi:hypothetical protein
LHACPTIYPPSSKKNTHNLLQTIQMHRVKRMKMGTSEEVPVDGTF